MKKKPLTRNQTELLQRLENIVSMVPVPIYWEDLSSRIIGANDYCKGAIGIPSLDGFVGKTPYELYPYKMAENIVRHNQYIFQGTHLSQEEPIKDLKTGEIRYYKAVKAPLYDEEREIIGLIGTSIEITEIKNMEIQLREAKEKAEENLKAKSDFLAVVSHELRTPLTGIIGIVEMLFKKKQLQKEKEYLQHIHNASNHLLNVINNILDFSKLNEAKFVLAHAPFDLRMIFTRVRNMLETKAKEKGLQFFIEYPKEYPCYFLGDEQAIMQVLINLVGNAIKFTESGGIVLRVVQEHRMKNYARLRIEIEDTGIGIPEENFFSIFQRFEQLGSVKVGANIGTGLGLTVSQKIVNLMHSQIFVDSVVGEGSVFSMSINFPLDLSYDKQVHATAIDEDIETTYTKGRRLLLVEDDYLICMVHQFKFSEYGFIIDVVTTAKDALSLCNKKKFDLIFMDLGLPDKPGSVAITKIRNSSKLNKKTIIIALTAYADEVHKEEVLDAGADGTLAKPVTNKGLNALFARSFQEPLQKN